MQHFCKNCILFILKALTAQIGIILLAMTFNCLIMKSIVGIASLRLLLKITFFLVMGSAFCMVQAQDIPKKYDPQKLKSDIDSLVKFIEDTHPDPYYRYPKDSFYSDIADVKRQITKPLSTLSFYQLIEPVLIRLEDGHTDLAMPLSEFYTLYPNPFKIPVRLKFSVNKPYISYQGPILPDLDIPLPVKLASFQARQEANQVHLIWSTTEESNSYSFEIERSSNGKTWLLLASQKAAGESNTNSSYSYTDAGALKGRSYYRLKMIDLDQTFAYSSIVSVINESAGSLTSWPNPSHDFITIKGLTAGDHIQIVNALGVKVASMVGRDDNFKYDISSLATGIYVIFVTNANGQVLTHRIAKQ